MRRVAGRGLRGRVALEETGAVLGDMLRRALAERLTAQAALRPGRLKLDRRDGGHSAVEGRAASAKGSASEAAARTERTGADGEGDRQ
jgi:hypothetical protein